MPLWATILSGSSSISAQDVCLSITQELEAQALAILDSLISTPFDECVPITRAFKNVTASASIYAVRHREMGLLYVGKTRYSRERFRDGHKAFLWSWLDRDSPEAVRPLLHPLNFISFRRYHRL